MMYTLTILLLGFYVFLAFLITLYCFLQLHLWYLYRYRSYSPQVESVNPNLITPVVTVQLPVFNEKFVVQRLVEKVVEMDYPQSQLQIQILDDSTDETLQISQSLAQKYRLQGYDIEVIHRENRDGFKAGALNHALPRAKGAFIAIFDADFLPKPSFLKKTVPHFENEKVAVVQTRWTHLNQNYSVLTRLQALQLNVHFTVEQRGRYVGGLLLQFNGTAGVWRKEAIQNSGGWQTDTITEDLDLSYRSQLAGYKVRYLEGVGSPAELPVEMSSLKSQQFRWMKGGAETARKLLPKVWGSTSLSILQKLHATGHLLNSSIFLLILLTGLVSLPLMRFLRHLEWGLNWLSIGLLGLLSIIVVYYEANVRFFSQKRLLSSLRFLLTFPVFLALSMGLSLHNSIAVIQGYLGKKTAFVRTPKFNVISTADHWQDNPYIPNKVKPIVLAEGMLGLCFAYACVDGLLHRDLGFVYLHLLFAIGFLAIFFYSFAHALAKRS